MTAKIPLRVDPNLNFDGNVLRGDRVLCSTSAEFAATIVRTMNAHDALVEIVEEYLKDCEWRAHAHRKDGSGLAADVQDLKAERARAALKLASKP